MPMHLKRICSAIDVLPPDIDFGVSEQLDLQVLDDPQRLSQHSEVDSLSTSQSLTVRLLEADATSWPSGENATALDSNVMIGDLPRNIVED